MGRDPSAPARLTWLGAILALAVLLLPAGCGQTGDGAAKKEVPSSQGLKIMRGDQVVREFTLEELKKLPQAAVEADGATLSGPTVKTVLGEAGITSCNEVLLVAPDGYTVTLTNDQLTDDLILALNEQGVKELVSPALPKQMRIRGPDTVKVQ